MPRSVYSIVRNALHLLQIKELRGIIMSSVGDISLYEYVELIQRIMTSFPEKSSDGTKSSRTCAVL